MIEFVKRKSQKINTLANHQKKNAYQEHAFIKFFRLFILADLNPREFRVMMWRYFTNLTQKQCSLLLEKPVSLMHIRRIIRGAEIKIRAIKLPNDEIYDIL